MHQGALPPVLARRETRMLRWFAFALSLTLAIGCSASPVKLGDTAYPSSALLASRAPAAADPNGSCPGSLRTAQSGPDVYGAWWEVRDDSSAILMVGRSTDSGRTWSIVQPADTSDHSRRGCNRPPPAVAADSTTNYVDIAYFMEAKEGPGVFFTHSMDARHVGTGDGIFHSPVAVVYGDKPANVAIATRGDQVALAYEDPNAEQSIVGLALSRTMGHIFEQRVVVSQPGLPAVDPLVAMHRDSVTVQWSERPDSVLSGGRVAVRSAVW
jgi:hypothetical protein